MQCRVQGCGPTFPNGRGNRPPDRQNRPPGPRFKSGMSGKFRPVFFPNNTGLNPVFFPNILVGAGSNGVAPLGARAFLPARNLAEIRQRQGRFAPCAGRNTRAPSEEPPLLPGSTSTTNQALPRRHALKHAIRQQPKRNLFGCFHFHAQGLAMGGWPPPPLGEAPPAPLLGWFGW